MIVLGLLLTAGLLLAYGLFNKKQDTTDKSETWLNKYLAKDSVESGVGYSKIKGRFYQQVDNWDTKTWFERVYKWYHIRYKLTYKERFLLSGTMLMWLTDKWHQHKAMQTLCMSTIICIWLIPHIGWLSILTFMVVPLLKGFGWHIK